MRRKLTDNLKRVRDQIQDACARSGRRAEEVRLVAVTKTVEADIIRAAVEIGLLDLGESRVQELVKRAGMINEHLGRRRAMAPEDTPPNPRWHMVGHLQRNKAGKAVRMFDMIQSVDSFRLAGELDKRGGEMGHTVDILVEVNTSGEESKYGMPPDGAIDLVGKISELPNLKILGLMTIGAFTDDESIVRKCFRTLRGIAEGVRRAGVPNAEMRYLSMGMTSDFEPAIEEGSNMVRIGTAIFGPR